MPNLKIWLRRLRRFNVFALAIVLTWAIALLSYTTIEQFWISPSPFVLDEDSSKSAITGKKLDGPNGPIVEYSSQIKGDFEAVSDVRYVSTLSGDEARLSDDNKARVYGLETLGKLGRIGLVKTGERKDLPVFDLVFVRFTDLKRFVVASAVPFVDSPRALDDVSFSAIVWDNPEKARFIIFDVGKGGVTLARNLSVGNLKPTEITGGDEVSACID